jgi:hypothetical protein
MPLEKQSGLFYEILIRGVCTADPQRQLGDIAMAHYIEGEAVIDTDTGEVVQYKPGPAQDLPTDQVASYLGDKLTAFEAQLRALERRLAYGESAADAAAAAAAASLAEKEAAIAARDARIADLTASHATEVTALIARGDELVARIAAAQAALMAVGG